MNEYGSLVLLMDAGIHGNINMNDVNMINGWIWLLGTY